ERWRALIVDADTQDRKACRRALTSSGLKVEIMEAVDCASAMSALQQQEFDGVFLDFQLSDSDGLAALRELRAAGIQTPVVVLTGEGDERLEVELMQAGASDCLSKSLVTPDTLSRSLRSAIRVHQAEMRARQAEAHIQALNERLRLAFK